MSQIAIPSPLNNFLELQLKSREGHDTFCSKVKEIPPRSVWKNIAPSLSQAYHFTTSNPFEVSCYLKRKNDNNFRKISYPHYVRKNCRK